MSTEYPTIQQHQPLRTPAGWDKQEKALIVQLDETFDDIYRRFGRLRLEDMGKKFRKQIADDEGNIAQMALDISGLTIEVGNKISKTTTYQTAESIVMAAESYTDTNAYGKVSGITITSSGIDITGSKYVKIESGSEFKITSGGKFTVDTDNLKIAGSSGVVESIGTQPGATKKTRYSFNVFRAYDPSDTDFFFNITEVPINSVRCLKMEYYKSISNIQYYRSDISISISDYAHTDVDETTPVKTAFIEPYATVMEVTSPTSATSVGTLVQSIGSPNRRFHYIYAFNISASNINTYTLKANTVQASAYNQSSSRDIKHDIQPLESQGAKIDALQPVTFVYDSDENERVRRGLIYEDTVGVMPEICTGDESNKAISYVELVPILLKEIQELRARVASLEGGQTNG